MKSLFMRMTCLTVIPLLFVLQNVMAQDWVARHAMSPAEYQTEFTNQANKGLRLTSLSGYTKSGKELYAAIWNKTAGPAWVARHGMSATDYQAAFTDNAQKGYRLISISGYAVGNSAKFAAIWDKSSAGAWTAKHNMTAAQYQTAFDDYGKQGYRLQYISGYVVGGTEYFAAIWNKAAGGALVAKHNLTAAQYQQAFTTYSSQGYTLKVVSGYEKNVTDLFAAIWEKASGPMWSSRHGIPGNNYQHYFDNMYYQGYKPVYVNAYAGDGADKYNVIWENISMKGDDIAKIDAAVNGYMTTQDIKGMSLAVTKNGRLVFAKGYGYADPVTNEELSPNHSMRIMSISKTLTSAGIMKLLEQGKISLGKKVFGPNSILGAKYATPADKPKLNDITVRDFMYHNSGMRSCNGEAEFWDQNKNHDDAAKMLLASPDLLTYGTNVKNIYSNTGYFFLMLCIEQISGQSYETFIRNNVLTPSGVGNTMYVGLASGGLKAGETHYTPDSKPNMQQWGGFGGWVARPMDLLKFLNRYDGSATPPDLITATTHDTMTKASMLSPGYGLGWIVNGDNQGHNGANGPSRSWMMEIGNGLSLAVISNMAPSNDPNGHTKMLGELSAAVKSVSAFPSYDLF